MNETQIAALKKTNPAELIQKALNASMELKEVLDSLESKLDKVMEAQKYFNAKIAAIEAKVG